MLFFVSYILNDNIKSFLVKFKAIKQSAGKVRDFYEYNQWRDEVSIHNHININYRVDLLTIICGDNRSKVFTTAE